MFSLYAFFDVSLYRLETLGSQWVYQSSCLLYALTRNFYRTVDCWVNTSPPPENFRLFSECLSGICNSKYFPLRSDPSWQELVSFGITYNVNSFDAFILL